MEITLSSVETGWSASQNRWEVVVEVRFKNAGDQLFELDKATACSGGQIQNSVFAVEVDGNEVDYLGMMKKRAHPGPDGFYKLKPGESHSVQVDVGEAYALPAEGGKVSVRFDHFNHFSPDSEQLTSKPVTIELKR